MDNIEPIREAARRLVRELHLLDGRYCIEGLSFSECHLVTELERLERASASELSDLLVLEKSTVSRLVKGLVRRGLVRVTVDEADRRRRWLELTDAGLEGASRVHHHARKQVQSALQHVAEPEEAMLVAGLHRYGSALRHARLSATATVRAIRKADNPRVAHIIRTVMSAYGAVGEGYSINDPEVDDMHGAYRPPAARFWVIERGGELLGCGGFGPLSGGGNGVCELRKMYFLPQLRGLGLGTRLLRRCIEQARKAGYREMYLETLASMHEARHLYRKHGFKDLAGPLGCTGHTSCNAFMSLALA